MKPKDCNETIDLNNVRHFELIDKLGNDTCINYVMNVKYNGEKYSKRKVYFNQDNGLPWWGSDHQSKSTRKVLDKFNQKTWYFLGGLGYPNTLYFVYLDSNDSFHVFRVVNWTN